ncbi:MAG: endo-1,4-beta-xylanase, partial [Paludibacter sp.]|nr:endo-1,4-beta-xylanase [Paludibacter sp.]
RNLVNQNFDEITPGNEMKQQSLMNTSGKLNFANADAVIARLQAAGLTIYGHCLVWHSQQQATFLNSLLQPTQIPGSPGESLVDGSFENGMQGWTPAYYVENYSIVTTSAIDGTHSLQVIIPADATGGKYDGHGQLNSPTFPIISGHHYQISFWIKGSAPGKVAIDFPNAKLGNQYPWVNGAEFASVGTTWTQVVYNTSTVGGTAMIATADDAAMKVRLLLAAVPDVTYLIDAIEITDLDAAPAVVNLVQNGNFENGLSGWNIPYYAENYTIETSDVIDGTQALQVIIPADATGGKYDGHGQLNSPEFPIINGHQYQISFWIKGSVTGKVAIDFPNANLGNQYPWVNGAEFAPVGTSWTQVIYNNTTVGGAAMIATADNAAMKVRLLLAAVPDVTYLIDALEVIDLDAAAPSPAPAINRGGPITIDKTPEEKAHIVDSVLVAYIDSVAKHFKGKIAAWDVVNEPMENNGRLRIGTEDLTATSYFYWAYYLGKDYAVKAFKAAHAADPSAKMFINDYALESANSAKLDSLIAYVKYIDDNGGQVDGIGTQLHLSINNLSDTVAIANMFTKLAATGKLIKISELDIAFSNSAPSSPVAPTLEQQGQQAKLYEYVARKYSQIIPVSQQYGITVWGVSDNANEHQYWLKNDAPCLWNADYTRKWSYKGFCDGLAGKDVGAEFPGTLQ